MYNNNLEQTMDTIRSGHYRSLIPSVCEMWMIVSIAVAGGGINTINEYRFVINHWWAQQHSNAGKV